jgi:hypothetical protein
LSLCHHCHRCPNCHCCQNCHHCHYWHHLHENLWLCTKFLTTYKIADANTKLVLFEPTNQPQSEISRNLFPRSRNRATKHIRSFQSKLFKTLCLLSVLRWIGATEWADFQKSWTSYQRAPPILIQRIYFTWRQLQGLSWEKLCMVCVSVS